MSSPEGVKNTTIDVSEKDPADGEETVEASTPAENGDVTLKDASGPDVSQDVSDDAEKVEEKADGPTVPEDEGKNGDGSETEGKDKEIEVSKEPEENNSKETEVSKEPEGNVKENDASMETEEKTKEAEASMEPEENDKTEASMETEENDKGTETEKKADPVEEVKTKSKENGTEDQKEDDDENKDEDAEMQDAKDEENAQDDAEETKTPRKRKKYAETLAKESAHILPESDSKRSRRSISANSYQPENFKDESLSSDPKLAITKGRGTALRDIPATKSKITSFKLGDPILKEAHKLLYGGPGGITGKGRTKPGSVKGNVLQFTGYLPAVEDNANATEEEKKAIEENEEKIHERYRTNVEKLQLPLIKSICDVFQIDRGTGAPLKKKELIELLLTFLESPSAEMVLPEGGRPAKKRGRKPGSKNKKKSVAVEKDEDEDDAFEVLEEESEGGKPSKAQLKKWVKAYINCFNLDKATAKHAIETASDKFGTDLSDKKAVIMDLLREAMSS